MVDANLISGVVIIGALLGAFGRAMLPYMRKLKEQEEMENAGSQPPVKFKQRYVWTIVFALVTAMVISLTAFPQLTANLPANAPVTSIFILSFLSTWGMGDVVNQIVATSGNLKPADSKPEVNVKEGLRGARDSSTTTTTQ